MVYSPSCRLLVLSLRLPGKCFCFVNFLVCWPNSETVTVSGSVSCPLQVGGLVIRLAPRWRSGSLRLGEGRSEVGNQGKMKAVVATVILDLKH